MIDMVGLLSAGSAVAGGIAGLFGGGGDSSGYDSAKDALWWGAQETSDAANRSMDAYANAYRTAQGYLTPYYSAGSNALNQYSNLMTPTSVTDMISGLPPGMDTATLTNYLRNLPGYQFNMNEGMNALDRSAASRGMVRSGAQTKAVQQYGQNYADNYLSKAQNSYQQYLSGLAGLTNMGQTTGTQLGNWAYQNAAGVTGINMNQAQMKNALMGQMAGVDMSQAKFDAAQNTNSQNTLSSLLGSLGKLGSSIYNSMGNSGNAFANSSYSTKDPVTNVNWWG
jgi:hypothetical protein